MTMAERFRASFERQERNEEGKYPLSPLWFITDEIVVRDDHRNTENSSPSSDATETWTFEDGSKLIVANPGQGAFAAFFR